MARVVLGLLIAVVPLVCWALIARTARTGWIVAGVLAACGGSAVGLAAGWVGFGEKDTLLAALALAMPLVIMAGSSAERRAGARRLRSGGVRGLVGLVVSAAYVGVSLIVVPLMILILLYTGDAYVPSGAEVLPLPAGLVVASDQDGGCGGGSATICTRQIVVTSTAGLPPGEIAQRVRDYLVHGRGWRLSQDLGDWGGCRTEGWLLDRQEVCIDLYAGQQRVTLLLQGVDNDD
jgi:hypothetical protein